MDDLLSLARLIASAAVAGGIIYSLYRGLRWQFPRLGPRRAKLIVGLGTVILASLAFSLLRTGGVECVQHENTVLLRGERIINLRQDTARPPRPMNEQRAARVTESCAYLTNHCPLDPSDETRSGAEEICRATFNK